jgi:hypothetical protein
VRPHFGDIKPQEIKTLVKTVVRVEDVLMPGFEARSQNCENRLLAQFFFRMRNASDKSCRENQNTYFMFNNFFSKMVPFMR